MGKDMGKELYVVGRITQLTTQPVQKVNRSKPLTCSNCGKPVLEEQEHYHDLEGRTWHRKCEEK